MQSEETRMIRAGIAGHGLKAADEEDSESSAEGEAGEEEGVSGSEGEEEAPSTSRRAMRVMSKAMDGNLCGVGLVLESWKPRGLAHALNLVARTNEAVRVDQLVPDGPADHAIPRMEKGDIVKEIDGEGVTSLAHAKELILGAPGSMVCLPYNIPALALLSFHPSTARAPVPRLCPRVGACSLQPARVLTSGRATGWQVTMKLVRNQYPFDVTIRRGLRGGAEAYPTAEPAAHDAADAQTSAPAPEPPSRKYVQGIPSLYSRSPKKGLGSALKGEGGTEKEKEAGDGASTAHRLLMAAQAREEAFSSQEASLALSLAPAQAQGKASPAAGSAPATARLHGAVLEARLRAMVPRLPLLLLLLLLLIRLLRC